MPLNSHRLAIMVDHCVITDARSGEDRQVDFPEPKHKMMASGSKEFCAKEMLKYHGEYECVIQEVETGFVGNPWEAEWNGVDRKV